MMLKRLIKDVIEAVKDPERDFSDRVFLIFSFISEMTVIIALIGDIVFKENIGEIMTLIAIVFIVPVTTIVCMYKNRLRFARRFLVVSLVVAVLPALFFFGGGLEGGGVIWIVFTFMYAGLVLTASWRKVIITMLIAMTTVCFYLAYYYPQLVWQHSRQMHFVDSFISIILVGTVCYIMTWSQNRLYMAENERAQKEAKRAEDLSKAQNRFFSNMSHEIRTPINSILGLNELILRERDISDETIADATDIQGAGKLLLALINDILDFSKMEAGSMELVNVDYHVGDMISEIVNMIWLKAYEKGLKFEVSIDPKVPSVLYGDEVRLKQIIINLLNNAVKYTDEGSVELHIESEDTDDKTTVLNISVSDTGIGIKKESIPYLFDVFKRVDEENNRYIEGTGLGLGIVKQLVELMGGTVTVNSVYGAGSTFTATIRQGISDPSYIGDLNIHNQQKIRKKKYESSFTAPSAKILIVDDNELNLEVERKLLAETGMRMDTVLSGRAALDMTMKTHYDVILMDHLMPEMNGIDCLKYIRSQTGGLNRTTPVIVLTANAGSDNRELYNRAGFDGYLIKPVSGDMLESMLMKHIAGDKLIISGKLMRMREDISTSEGYARKSNVIVTSSSMSDLPDAVIKKYNIPIIPFLIRTDEGVFRDSVQMDANELISYLNDGGNATSSPPSVKAYTQFFADTLKRTHNLIHISLTTSMSEDYNIASEAARSFDNVTVINSECISSSAGILVLIATKLAQQNTPVDEIIAEIEMLKKRLRCSFVIDTTEYMAKKGLISKRANRIARSLGIHPGLKYKDDKAVIGSMWMGSTKMAYRRYIHKVFPVDIIPDSDVVFITYADVPMETLHWIKEEVSKIHYFEHVVFQKASAAISSNCGPGAFGILYFVKSNKSYNIGSFIEDDTEDKESGEDTAAVVKKRVSENRHAHIERAGEVDSLQPEWYEKLKNIDAVAAIENSGSEEAFKKVLKMFFDSIPAKYAELEEYFNTKDWENYTIRIHALKSSAKLIGAMELSEDARFLETAGKEGNIGFIKGNHARFMEELMKLKEELAVAVFGDEEAGRDTVKAKPAADELFMQSVYEELYEAAESMLCDSIEDILGQIDKYSVSEEEMIRIDAIREKVGEYDYDGIIRILGERQKVL